MDCSIFEIKNNLCEAKMEERLFAKLKDSTSKDIDLKMKW